MNAHPSFLRLSASVLAVQAALSLLSVVHAAEDPALAELTRPKSHVELGVAASNSDSTKAHEFDGVNRQGGQAVGGLDVIGGGAYDSEDATRWRLKASDLGLKSSSMSAEYGEQGRFRLKMGYDTLLRNRSDSFQTPYQGVGGNVLGLPANWVVPVVPRVNAATPNARGLSPDVTSSNAIVAGASTAPTPAQLSTAAALQAADLPAFNQVRLSTQRAQLSLGGDVQLDSRWSASVSGSHEHKTGLKPLSALTRITGGDISTTLPQPVDQNHDQYRVGVQYVGDGATLQAAYDASMFSNNVSSVAWTVWADPTKTQSMSTAPSNQFHKLSLAGSLDLSKSTKVVGDVAYGRATQNAAFLNDGLTGVPLLPTTSLEGLVVTESANLKLLSKPSKDVRLSGAYKLDVRDNRTAVNTYGFYDVGELPAATASVFGAQYGSNINLNANRPYSRKLQQLSLDADYRLQPGQQLQAGVDAQTTDKYCASTWIDCADAAKSREQTLRAEWRWSESEALQGRVGMAKSKRTVTYNENAFLALVPMAAVSPTGAPGGATAYDTLVALGLTGYGPVSGLNPAAAAGSAQAFFFPNNNALSNVYYANNVNRISELIGMRHFNNANRDRNKLRTSAQWQASETITFQGGLDYNADSYGESVYGLKQASSWALNLDGTYSPSDRVSVSLFYSREDQRSRSAGNSYTANSAVANVGGATLISGGCYADIATRNANNKIDPCLNWSADMRDKIDTVGLSVARTGLLGGSLDVRGSLILSQLRSDTGFSGGNYVNNPYAGSVAAGAVDPTIAAYYIPAAALPTVSTDSVALRLGGAYKLDTARSVRMAYGYQRLKTSDWAYEAMQPGGLTQVLPTGEGAPTYTVHSLAVAYVSAF
ncbi:MAG: MtrB/PioB family decaheme-associated outer membrane protein [Leptothrix ochracea]|uniref:MtrB/PioB family decaheme-associated outer membrane protein n=1 Tax=Leptothrix ochracea TaxID=735331 RepID=UPI0034E2E652